MSLLRLLCTDFRRIALVKNQIRIVQASLLGSMLANLLLILGMAFIIGGLNYREQIYNATVTQMSACLLSLAVLSLLIPTVRAVNSGVLVSNGMLADELDTGFSCIVFLHPER
jgi:calcium/proton exchanger cax